jgi:hypothetical protein
MSASALVVMELSAVEGVTPGTGVETIDPSL